MEEDIKILKKFIKEIKEEDPLDPYFDEEAQAIEHLIARNKELEEEKKELLLRLKADGLIERDKYWINKIKEKLLKPIQEEGEKAYKSFMSKKKEENFEIDGALLQELGAIEGMIIELLED